MPDSNENLARLEARLTALETIVERLAFRVAQQSPGHDLRNALDGVRAWSRLVRNGGTPEEIRTAGNEAARKF